MKHEREQEKLNNNQQKPIERIRNRTVKNRTMVDRHRTE